MTAFAAAAAGVQLVSTTVIEVGVDVSMPPYVIMDARRCRRLPAPQPARPGGPGPNAAGCAAGDEAPRQAPAGNGSTRSRDRSGFQLPLDLQQRVKATCSVSAQAGRSSRLKLLRLLATRT